MRRLDQRSHCGGIRRCPASARQRAETPQAYGRSDGVLGGKARRCALYRM